MQELAVTHRLPAVVVLLALGLSACSPLRPTAGAMGIEAPTPAREFRPEVGQSGKDVVWVPTPNAVVERMLDFAQVKPGDYVIDLGSGDGKIAIAAARRGARSLGIEYNPDMVALSRRNAEAAGLPNVRFVQGDIFETDFSQADVVTLYLLPALNLRLRPILLRMKPGTRIASHDFNMGDWPPDEAVGLVGGRALFWRVPADVMGQWQVHIDGGASLDIDLTQHYQRVSGHANWGAARAPLSELQLSGGEIRFAATDPRGAVYRFTGSAGHDGRMSGQVAAHGTPRTFTATRVNRSAL